MAEGPPQAEPTAQLQNSTRIAAMEVNGGHALEQATVRNPSHSSRSKEMPPIDFSCEHLLTIAQAAREAPGRPNVSTIFRWIQRGVRNVRLESNLVGGRRFTSREALQRFIARCSAAAAGDAPPVRTPHQRERDIARAERELSEAGI